MKALLVETAVPGAPVEPRADRLDSRPAPDRGPEMMVVTEAREIDLDVFQPAAPSVTVKVSAVAARPCDQPQLLDIEIWFG